MGFVPEYHYYYYYCVLSVMLLLPALCYSQYAYTSSRATYYGSPDCLGTPTGACGFGEYGRTANEANVAGVARRLWKNGTGCGACYQVRCTAPHLCTADGVNIVVTDYGEGDKTDFILSPLAYGRMAPTKEASAGLYAYGVVDVEFRRVPCRHSGYNLVVKIHEHSNPHYLALVVLYVPGLADVLAVEIWLDDHKEWVALRRAYGAYFDIANPPKDVALRFRFQFQVSGSAELTWVEPNGAVPSDYKVGAAYDLAFQL